MTAADLLTQARADGLTVALEPPARLTLRGDPASVARWAPVLRPHKPALLALLSGPPPLPPETGEAIRESVLERAAIMEHDAQVPCTEATREARASMRVYSLRIAMGPGQAPKSVALLAPGCTLEDARREALGRFGAERLIEIQEHPGWS